jgi:hypothetical protein
MIYLLQEKLKQDSYPMIACKPCLEKAKKLHGFASKCAEINKTEFPKQDWWANIKD